MSPLAITVIGSLNCDMVTVTPRIPDQGETLTASTFNTVPGGKGANQALAVLRLSRVNPKTPDSLQTDQNDLRVQMIGAVGADPLRHITIATLETDGVDISGVRVVDRETTGVAVVLVEEASGENRILLTPGANHSLQPKDFLTLESLTGKSLHKPDLLILQLEIPLTTVNQIVKTAVRENIDVLLNTAPAPEGLPRDLYEDVMHLILNETEATTLSSKQNAETEDIGGWGIVTDYFLKQGVKNVVITLGAKGAYFSHELGKGSHVPSEADVRVVDTTGAGDTFVGAYAIEVVRQKRVGTWDIGKAVKWACKAATRAVEGQGAQEAIPWGNEIEAS